MALQEKGDTREDNRDKLLTRVDTRGSMAENKIFYSFMRRTDSRSETSVICAYRFVACGPLTAKDLQGSAKSQEPQ